MSRAHPGIYAAAPPRTAILRLLLLYLPLLAALGFRVASEQTANISYLLLAVYALFGRPHLIRALVFSWLFTMISPGLAPDAPLAALGRYAVLFAAALSAFANSRISGVRRGFDPLVVATLVLGGFIVVHSALVSPLADVSILKGVSWTVALATCASAWDGLGPGAKRELSDQLYWLLLALLVVSMPLAATSLGYLRNGTGFQGILNHPQAFGPTMGLVCAWSVARLLSSARPRWWLMAVVGTALLAVLLSEARTAGLALAIGVAVAILSGPFIARRPLLAVAPGLSSPRIWGVLIAVFVGVLIMAPALLDMLDHYLSKSGRADVSGLWSAYEVSRGRQIEVMLENIQLQPWFGIGFGIDSEPALMQVSRDPLLGLPLGAATEKGVAPLMVLEELGVFGAALAVWWASRLIRAAAAGGLAPLAVALTVLFINFGEATVFSPSGFGLLSIILLGWAYAQGRQAPGQQHG